MTRLPAEIGPEALMSRYRFLLIKLHGEKYAEVNFPLSYKNGWFRVGTFTRMRRNDMLKRIDVLTERCKVDGVL